MDGVLTDLAPALTIKSSKAPGENGASSSFSAKVGYRKDTLFLGVEVRDDRVVAGDLLTVTLFFANAQTTARGYSYRFAFDGKRAPDPESGPPSFANKLVQAAVRKNESGMIVEAAFPARALPRFPVKGPMVLELCLSYEDRDEVAGPVTTVTNCSGGAMVGEVLRLPDGFRNALKLRPPPDVIDLEGREHGWAGFALLDSPSWVFSDRELTPETLRSFFLEDVRDPIQYRISLPPRMSLPDGRILLSILTGSDPFAAEGPCKPQKELRIGLFLVQGRTAARALEWPAATCALGRASSVVLEEDGSLTIGYSSGSTASFAWSGDHFERTEIG